MGKYDSSLGQVDQENSVVHESFSEQKTESWGSWFCRHGSQIAKGSIALLGLGAIGVVTKMLFGLKSFSSREGASSSVSRVEEVSDDVAVLFEGQSVPIVSQRLQMPKEQPKLLSNFVVEKKASDSAKTAFSTANNITWIRAYGGFSADVQ